MMFVSLGIGTVLAIALIVVVSLLTGGTVTGAQGQNALVGTSLRDFSATGLSGGTVRAPWTSGHPAVVVFFASWCEPCKAEMPRVAAYVSSHHLGDVRVVGVDYEDAKTSARHFVTKDRVTFPVAYDTSGLLTAGVFKLQGLPDTVFVNGHGVVTEVHVAAVSDAQLSAGIKALATSN